MLSKESFNSLLKTLEEPPEHVIFLFATTEIDKVPPTVLSRCVQFNLSAMKAEIISDQLKLIFDNEKIKYDEGSLSKLSNLARGSMRDALTLSEKVISFSEGKITEKKVDINILLNRVKVEQKDKIRKNFIITAGAIGTLAITGLISII